MLPSLAHVSLALLASSALFPSAGPLPVGAGPAVPAGWYSGDTHVHGQPCGAGPDLDLNAIVQDMIASGVNVGCGLYWNATKDFAGEQKYWNVYAPSVDGNLDSASLPGSNTILQFGVEVSGFACSQFGHVSGIGIDDGFFPDVAATGQVLEFFRAQPGAITGFAHVRWPLDYTPLTDGQLYHLVPSMLPIELSLGTADYMEAPNWDPTDLLDWRGAYYKLLNCGLRISLAAGTDNPCLYPTVGPMQVFARVDGPGLDFDAWTAAVKAGRTTISANGTVFLDLDVAGQPIGGELSLPAPSTVPVTITLIAPDNVATQGTLRLIQGGISVAETAIDLPSGGSTTFSPSVDIAESSWLAASFEHVAHSGATYVIVGDQPIASTPDALYFQDMAERMVSPQLPFKPGASAGVIAQRATKSAETFAALAAIESPPAGTSRYGASTPACEGPIAIGATAPPVGGGPLIGITCVHAPPSTFGMLLIGDDQDLASIEILGAQLYIDALTPYSIAFASSNAGGYARVNFTLAPELAGLSFHAQYGWLNTPTCPGAGMISTSDALLIQVQ